MILLMVMIMMEGMEGQEAGGGLQEEEAAEEDKPLPQMMMVMAMMTIMMIMMGRILPLESGSGDTDPLHLPQVALGQMIPHLTLKGEAGMVGIADMVAIAVIVALRQEVKTLTVGVHKQMLKTCPYACLISPIRPGSGMAMLAS